MEFPVKGINAEVVSLEGPVEIVDGELAILMPLDAGRAVLAPLAKGIGEIDGEFLKVVIQPWLAERLRIWSGKSSDRQQREREVHDYAQRG
jgi:hypothetical protein